MKTSVIDPGSLSEVLESVQARSKASSGFSSSFEAFAFLQRDMDALWDGVKEGSAEKVRQASIMVAATSLQLASVPASSSSVVS